MRLPRPHRVDHKKYVTPFRSHQQLQLQIVVEAQEVVNGCEDHHAHHVAEGVSKQSMDTGAPVIEDVLRELPRKVISEETADNSQPNDQKREQIAEDCEQLVFGREAEAEVGLREHHEEEVLQIAVQQQGRQVNQEAEGAQEDRHAVVEEQAEAPAQQREGRQHEEQVEGEEVPAGGQEGLAGVLGREEGGVRVVALGVDDFIDGRGAGLQGPVYLCEEVVAQQFPLFLLKGFYGQEEQVDVLSIVSLVILVEPDLIQIEQKAEKRQGFTPTRNFVQYSNDGIIHKNFQQRLIYRRAGSHQGVVQSAV